MTEQQSIERRAFTQLHSEATALLERIRKDSSRVHDILRVMDGMLPCDHHHPNGQSALISQNLGIKQCQICNGVIA